MDAVLADLDAVFPTYDGDFFPYADDDKSYWTGFYSSRPNLKGAVRQAQIQYMTSNTMLALASLKQSASTDDINAAIAAQDELYQAVGILSHHDGVTGTARQAVVDDYLEYAYSGIDASDSQVYKTSLNSVLGVDYEWQTCLVTNGTHLDCEADYGFDGVKSGKKSITIAMINPSSTTRKDNLVHIKAEPGCKYVLRLGTDVKDADLICRNQYTPYPSPQYVQSCELWWRIDVIKPYEILRYTLSKQYEATAQPLTGTVVGSQPVDVSPIGSSVRTFATNSDGKLTFTREGELGDDVISLEYRTYTSYNEQGDQQCVYIFRPQDETSWSQLWNKNCAAKSYSGKVVNLIECKGDTVDVHVLLYPERQNYLTYDVYSVVKGLPDDQG